MFPTGNSCGAAATCAGRELSNHTCDGTATCHAVKAPCPNNLVCNATGTACLTSCTVSANCANGYYCSAGTCLAQQAQGPCSGDDACATGICGADGTGYCCAASCATADATCGATDCDDAGTCVYPSASTACGTSGCNGAIISSQAACGGEGSCVVPVVADCSPYACSGTSCLSSCTDNTACAPGNLCDTTSSTCCSGPGDNGTLNVDSVLGDDSVTCCGTGSNTPCQTLTHAMALIGLAKATGVTINATVGGSTENYLAWQPPGEVYPIVLGWGVELRAPGIYFDDNQNLGELNEGEIFDVANLGTSATDSASIAGLGPPGFSQLDPLVYIGASTYDYGLAETDDDQAIRIEANATLYLANVLVTGNATAITVAPGGALRLGEDQLGTLTGTVYIGDPATYYGGNGITCQTDSVSLGCVVKDAALVGQSSVAIQGRRLSDIDAEDFADISLTSSPIIGVAPVALGFSSGYGGPTGCWQKIDNFNGGAAILAHGAVNLTFENGTIQCMAGPAFDLQASSNGSPSIIIDNTVIQNTQIGIYAAAGNAVVSNSSLQFNYRGVQQDTDGTNNGTIDLGGGGVGGNAVICSKASESSVFGNTAPGVDVYNTSSALLAANNVAWDTTPGRTGFTLPIPAIRRDCACDTSAPASTLQATMAWTPSPSMPASIPRATRCPPWQWTPAVSSQRVPQWNGSTASLRSPTSCGASPRNSSKGSFVTTRS